jgi:periplasmic protein TonB
MSAPVAEREQSHATAATLILELEPRASGGKKARPTHGAAEYKKHSLAAGYWGDISLAQAPLRQVATTEAQDTFLRGLLDMPTEHKERHPAEWLVSVVVHMVVVAAVLIAPLAFTQALDIRNLQLTYLAVPRPPAAAPPPPAAMQQVARRVVRPIQASALTAPALIPKRIAQIKDEPAPDISADGVIGGIPGGEAGGVLGGILGTQHATPPAPAATAAKKIYRVGGEVKPPRELTIVQPVYSPIAMTAHVEGVVEVDAVIDEHGDVIEARAVSGPGLLMPAAVKAVSQWKYEPTYLDGIPVAIRMEVHVVFHLH